MSTETAVNSGTIHRIQYCVMEKVQYYTKVIKGFLDY